LLTSSNPIFLFLFCRHAFNLRREEARDNAAAAAASAATEPPAAEAAPMATDPFNEMPRKERKEYVDNRLKTKVRTLLLLFVL